MPKFYVACGELETVIVAPNEMDAAVRAFRRLHETGKRPALGAVVGISQHTFDVMNYEGCDAFIYTPHVIRTADLEGDYDVDSFEEAAEEMMKDLTDPNFQIPDSPLEEDEDNA